MRLSTFRSTLAGTAAVGLLTLSAPLATAHDAVIGGDPADGATVNEFPESVTLEFSGIPREGFNTFALSDADTEEVLYTGEPTIEGQTLTLDIPENVDPGAGDYRIGFQITSSDGHATQGMTTFTVSEGAGATSETAPADPAEEPTAEPAAEESEQEGLSGPVVWAIAALAVLALVAVVVMIVRKGRVSRELDDHPENNPEA